MCMCLGVCVFVCIILLVCAAMRHARQQTKFHNFSTVAAAVMLSVCLDFFSLFFLCRFEEAINAWSQN